MDIDHWDKGGRVVSLRISLTHKQTHTHTRLRAAVCGCVGVCARASES